MSRRITIRFPAEFHQRLKALAEKTGRTPSFHIREAVDEHLEDVEDRYTAEAALLAQRHSNAPTLSLDRLDVELGLEG